MFTQDQIRQLSEAEKQGKYIARKLAQVQHEERRKLEYERNRKCQVTTSTRKAITSKSLIS
jgi:hypothetical protein